MPTSKKKKLPFRMVGRAGMSRLTIVAKFKKRYPKLSIPEIAERIHRCQLAGTVVQYEGKWYFIKPETSREKQILELLPNEPMWISYWQLMEKTKLDASTLSYNLAKLYSKGVARREGRLRWSKVVSTG